jgi:hypothetical protein
MEVEVQPHNDDEVFGSFFPEKNEQWKNWISLKYINLGFYPKVGATNSLSPTIESYIDLIS